MPQRAIRYLGIALEAAAALAALWRTIRFLLPWLAPLLLSLAIAALMEPPVRFLVGKGWRRGAAAGLMSVAALGLLGWGIGALLSWAASEAVGLARQVPAMMAGMASGLSSLEERALETIATAPEELTETLRLALDAAGESLYAIPGHLSQWALDALGRLAQQGPDALLFVVTAGIGSYFCSASFPRLLAFFEAQIPAGTRERLRELGRDLRGSCGGWLRAQLILMGITFFELLLAFLLLGVEGAMGLAALTAIVDALPVFGTGIVLVPWALGCLLLDELGRGLGLLVTWGVSCLVRSCIQAKLLGDEIGLDPLASLTAMYVGWRVCSVWGMLLFPVLLVTLQQLNDRGVLHLWRKS